MIELIIIEIDHNFITKMLYSGLLTTSFVISNHKLTYVLTKDYPLKGLKTSLASWEPLISILQFERECRVTFPIFLHATLPQ